MSDSAKTRRFKLEMIDRFEQAAAARTVILSSENSRMNESARTVSADLDVRRCPVRRFPLALVFIEMPDEIRILAAAHGRRRPGYWRSRL
jgi:hypothetical protein